MDMVQATRRTPWAMAWRISSSRELTFLSFITFFMSLVPMPHMFMLESFSFPVPLGIIIPNIRSRNGFFTFTFSGLRSAFRPQKVKNMVTGLPVPDGGAAMILGRDVWRDLNAVKRSIGVMPQPDQIFDRLTGLQLLVYAGMLRGMKRDESVKRANDLLGAFDLTGAANVMVADYSAGMTKKICLASAMIHSPRVLVLDANLRDILIEYASTGGTVIISSHVMALVEKMCTHVAVINKGQVCAAGTVEQVAAGEDLEERFLQLVGGRHAAARLSWLDGGAQ